MSHERVSESQRVWMDISQESSRTYLLPSGQTAYFGQPTKVGIKRVEEYPGGPYKDSHVVHCANGDGGYVADFEAIVWTNKTEEIDPDFSERLNDALETGATEA